MHLCPWGAVLTHHIWTGCTAAIWDNTERGFVKWMDWGAFCSIRFRLSFLSCIMDAASLLHHCLLILIRVLSLLNNKTGGQNENVSELQRNTCWLEPRLHLSQLSLTGLVASYITACTRTHTNILSAYFLCCPWTYIQRLTHMHMPKCMDMDVCLPVLGERSLRSCSFRGFYQVFSNKGSLSAVRVQVQKDVLSWKTLWGKLYFVILGCINEMHTHKSPDLQL